MIDIFCDRNLLNKINKIYELRNNDVIHQIGGVFELNEF